MIKSRSFFRIPLPFSVFLHHQKRLSFELSDHLSGRISTPDDGSNNKKNRDDIGNEVVKIGFHFLAAQDKR